MDPFTMFFALVVTLAALYYVISAAVFAGLRRHSIWTHGGSMERDVSESRAHQQKRRR